MSKLRINDRVHIDPDSYYYGFGDDNPDKSVIGTVTYIDSACIDVMWDNGLDNSYREWDLVKVENGLFIKL
jgi:hypothetical protein